MSHLLYDDIEQRIVPATTNNIPINPFLVKGSSPNSCDTKAVIIKVRLFVTGTANDNSVACSAKTNKTLPV